MKSSTSGQLSELIHRITWSLSSRPSPVVVSRMLQLGWDLTSSDNDCQHDNEKFSTQLMQLNRSVTWDNVYGAVIVHPAYLINTAEYGGKPLTFKQCQSAHATDSPKLAAITIYYYSAQDDIHFTISSNKSQSLCTSVLYRQYCSPIRNFAAIGQR